MRLSTLIYFLTLVLTASLVHAKPHGDEALDLPKTIHHQDDLVDPTLGKNLSSRDFTAELGYLSGKYLKDGEHNTNFIGARVIWLQKADRSNDLGMRVFDKAIGLDGNHRFYPFIGDYYEPYWAIGVGSIYTSDDGLANFVDIRKYHLKISAGFENMFYLRRSVRLSVELMSSMQGFSYAGLIAYKF